MHLSSISQPASARVSPIARDLISPTRITRRSATGGQRSAAANYISRSYNNSPLLPPGSSTTGYYVNTDSQYYNNTSSAYPPAHGFPYYDDPGSPIFDTRNTVPGVGLMSAIPQTPGTGIVHGPRARSARIPVTTPAGSRYHTLDGRTGIMDPMMDPRTAGDPYYGRDPRDRSLDRLDPITGQPRGVRMRDRSLDRGTYLRDDYTSATGMAGYRDPLLDDPYVRDGRSLSHSVPVGDPRHSYSRDSLVMELQARLSEIQTQYAHVKRELDATTQKLGSSMHSIKTFWSPELKKERALRKEEAAKFALLSDQLKILRSENQVRLLTVKTFLRTKKDKTSHTSRKQMIIHRIHFP